jgi:hypothetical protein
MSQDKSSGAEGNRYGHECGKKIATALGAQMLRAGSNECLLNGERIVIKCAHKGTSSVGVTHQMLNRIVAVVGAFEQADGSYHVLRLSAEQYAAHMHPTRSRGPSAGRVGTVKTVVFAQEGTALAVLPYFGAI